MQVGQKNTATDVCIVHGLVAGLPGLRVALSGEPTSVHFLLCSALPHPALYLGCVMLFKPLSILPVPETVSNVLIPLQLYLQVVFSTC